MNDALAVIGLGTMAVGITARYDWMLACIIVGGLIFSLAVIGAMRR